MEELILNIFSIFVIVNVFLLPLQKKSNLLFCGMVGFSGVENFDSDKIKILLLANMTRGIHSTGMYNNGKIIKETGDAIDFLHLHKLVPETMFFGHDRFATIGAKDADNAHPFEFGDIVGQHNGTLKNHWALLREHDLEYKDYDVDSQVLISLIDKDQKNLSVLQEFEGAAALIWHNKNFPNRIYCFRNIERPLFRGKINKNMYISSIEESLDIIGCTDIQSFKENYVYAIESGEILLKESKQIIKKVLKPVSSYKKKEESITQLSASFYSEKTGSLDKTCKWIQRKFNTAGNSPHKFIIDEWYFIKKIISNQYCVIIDEEEKECTMETYAFTVIEDLNVNGLVKVAVSDGTFFEKGETVYLRGLEFSKESNNQTIAVIEKLTEEKSVYTWPSKYLRNMTESEKVQYVKSNKKLNIQEEVDDEMTTQEALAWRFENEDSNKDENGNRLGGLMINVGSVYESFIQIRQELDDIRIQLVNFKKTTSNFHNLKNIEIDLEKVFDLAENEVENLFDRLYEMYNDTIEEADFEEIIDK